MKNLFTLFITLILISTISTSCGDKTDDLLDTVDQMVANRWLEVSETKSDCENPDGNSTYTCNQDCLILYFSETHMFMEENDGSYLDSTGYTKVDEKTIEVCENPDDQEACYNVEISLNGNELIFTDEARPNGCVDSNKYSKQ